MRGHREGHKEPKEGHVVNEVCSTLLPDCHLLAADCEQLLAIEG